MPPIDSFLQAVEKSLRSPAERRPEIIEELRGHLQDRIEALLQQGQTPEEAERAAIRELGSARQLAGRLSAVPVRDRAAHFLRELWALILGMQIVFFAAPFMQLQNPSQIVFQNVFLAKLGATLGLLVAIIALFAFSFALGRIVQGWLWAVLPAWLITKCTFPQFDPAATVVSFYFTAVFFLGAALLGRRKTLPRLSWLAIAAPFFLIAGGLGATALRLLAQPTQVLPNLSWLYFHWQPKVVLMVLIINGLAWSFWLGARLLGQTKSSSIARA